MVNSHAELQLGDTLKLSEELAFARADGCSRRPVSRCSSNESLAPSRPSEPLEWTHLPQTQIDEVSGMRCRISVPSVDRARHHAPHLKQTLRMEPIRQADKPPLLPIRFKEQIVVKEADLKKFGTDIKSLRECQLKSSTSEWTSQDRFESSFKTAFAKRCRTDEHFDDQWKNMQNPELTRELNEQDLVLNQVWIKAIASRNRSKDILLSSLPSQEVVKDQCFGDAGAAALDETSRRRRLSKSHRRRRIISCQTPSPLDVSGQGKDWLENGGVRRSASECGIRATGRRSGSRPCAKAVPSSRIQPIENVVELQDYVPESSSGSVAVRTGTKQQRSGLRHLEQQLHYDVNPRSAWMSLCPRTGEATFYPRKVAERLESAYRDGRASVPLAGLGKEFDGSIVTFATLDEGSKNVETGLTGRVKEVQRVPVPSQMKEAIFHVTREDGQWRYVAEEEKAQMTAARQAKGDLHKTLSAPVEERCLMLSSTEVVNLPDKLPPVNRTQRTYFINAASEYWI